MNRVAANLRARRSSSSEERLSELLADGYPLPPEVTRPSRVHHVGERERPRSGAFLLADDGIRTHDLLHGKQML
jgi:hypothetical protein